MGHRLKRKYKNLTIRVYRKDKQGNYVNSKPCNNCIIFMKQYHIKYVIYSNSENGFTREKLSEIVPTHYSKGYRRMYNMF